LQISFRSTVYTRLDIKLLGKHFGSKLPA
jgi:hypothetical protein